jgi:DNA repair protein RadC
VLTEGSADECLLPVRELLTAVLLHDGSSFAVAHNHPSGDVTPSQADLAVTASLTQAAQAVGLEFLTHVVVSADAWVACDPPSVAEPP